MTQAVPYVVLARKYRPRRFADVIGQEPVVATLRNALRSGRVGSAYLFCGPRGVGKTTLARILSMSLCCPKGEGGDPCGDCEPCRRIGEGEDLDVLEIDGASHTGVEEIRRIQEVVMTMPVRSPYRIYIIDEVHMLSLQAFNALLKTLEEPPAHVKFLFATTHPHKIPPTILSRCQRFDLRRIRPEAVAEHLARIARAEGIEAEGAALALVAACADGGLRDALTLLDQARAFSAGGRVDAEGVRGMLGLADPAQAEGMLQAALAGDAPEVLAAVDRLWDAGVDFAPYAQHLLESIRARTAPASPEERPRLRRLAQAILAALPDLAPDRSGRAALECALLSGLEEGGAPRAGAEPRAAPVPEASPPAPRAETPPPAGTSPANAQAGERKGSAPPAAEPVTLERLRARWDEFLAAVKERRKTTAAFLAEAEPVAAGEGGFELAFRSAFHRDSVEAASHRACVEEAFRAVFAAPARMRTRISASAPPPSPSGGQLKEEPGPEAEAGPLVRKAAEIFQGRIVVRRKEAEP